MHTVRHLILLNVGLILLLEHVIGHLHALAHLVYVHEREAHHAPFGHLVFRLVLFIGGADFRFIR